MANGANRTFLKEKQAFLKKNIINVAVTTTKLEQIAAGNVDPTRGGLAHRGRVANKDAGIGQAAGIYEFDLIKSTARAKVETSAIGIKHFSSVPVYDLQEWGKKSRDQIVTKYRNEF